MLQTTVMDAAVRLEAAGVRPTSKRVVLLEALMASRHAVTARDLHALLELTDPQLGLATVYRALDVFVQHGLAEPFPQENSELRYTYCSSEHHHHLVCRSCGEVREVAGCVVSQIERDVADEMDFAIEGHALTFYGRCKGCSVQ